MCPEVLQQNPRTPAIRLYQVGAKKQVVRRRWTKMEDSTLGKLESCLLLGGKSRVLKLKGWRSDTRRLDMLYLPLVSDGGCLRGRGFGGLAMR